MRLLAFLYNYTQLQQHTTMTVYDSLHSLLDYECLLFHWSIRTEEALLTLPAPYEFCSHYAAHSHVFLPFITSVEPNRGHPPRTVVILLPLVFVFCPKRSNLLPSNVGATVGLRNLENVFTEALPSNRLFRLSGVMSQCILRMSARGLLRLLPFSCRFLTWAQWGEMFWKGRLKWPS
jgi:hypothetical protein